MPTHENNDQLFEMDFDAAKNLPRNPYTNKVSSPIQDPMGNPPDYAALSGPHYEGSFSPPAADSPPKVETEGGFPEPVAAEYGDEKLEQPIQAQSQGTITTPVVPPASIERLPGYKEHRRIYFQQEQANKTPDTYNTQGNLLIPAIPGTVYQLAGRNKKRDVLVISNTGVNPFAFGKTEDAAKLNGFTVAAGGVISIEGQDSVFVYVSNALQTTVDVLETVFA